MAIIKSFETISGTGKLNPTEVIGFVTTFRAPGGGIVVQIKTTGSDQRAVLGATSQTLQFKEDSARELYDILKRTYRFD